MDGTHAISLTQSARTAFLMLANVGDGPIEIIQHGIGAQGKALAYEYYKQKTLAKLSGCADAGRPVAEPTAGTPKVTSPPMASSPPCVAHVTPRATTTRACHSQPRHVAPYHEPEPAAEPVQHVPPSAAVWALLTLVCITLGLVKWCCSAEAPLQAVCSAGLLAGTPLVGGAALVHRPRYRNMLSHHVINVVQFFCRRAYQVARGGMRAADYLIELGMIILFIFMCIKLVGAAPVTPSQGPEHAEDQWSYGSYGALTPAVGAGATVDCPTTIIILSLIHI